MKKFIRLLAAIALCEGVGIMGSVFTFSSVYTWYSTLSKPFFNPPSWIFGPVWTALYLLMGIALFFAWQNKANLKWFYIQLGLNFLWSIIFFGLQNPLLALMDIVLLWMAIFATLKVFWKKSRISAYLFIPYIAWVSFAVFLNLAIVVLNR